MFGKLLVSLFGDSLKRKLAKSPEAEDLYSEGDRLFRDGDISLAAECWQRALELFEEVDDKSGIADSWGGLGNASLLLGRYTEATQYQNKRLQLARKIDATGKVEACVLNDLAQIERHRGNIDSAFALLNQSLNLGRNSGDLATITSTLSNLANLHYLQANYGDASRVAKESLRICQKIGRQQGVIHSLILLGQIANNDGNYESALKYLRQGLTLAKASSNRHLEASILNHLAAVHLCLGDLSEAISLGQQGLKVAKEKNFEHVAIHALHQLAITYREHDSPDTIDNMASLLEEMLEISQRIGYQHGEGNALSGLGDVSLYRKDYSQALSQYKRSLAIKDGLDDIQGQAAIYGQVGSTHSAAGQTEAAFDAYRKALELTRLANDPLGEGTILSHLGMYYLLQGEDAVATERFLQSIEIWETLRSQAGNSDTNKIFIYEAQHRTYCQLQLALVNQGLYLQALEVAERSRARGLTELIHGARLNPVDTPPPSTADMEQVAASLGAQIVVFSLIFADVNSEGPLRARLSEVFIWLVSPETPIQFRRIDASSLRRRSHKSSKNLENSYENRPLGAFRWSADLREVLRRRKRDADMQTFQRTFYDCLLVPLKNLLREDPEQPILFVPEPALFAFPFGLLLDHQQRFFFEGHSFGVLPSFWSLQPKTSREHCRGNEILVVGNPTMPTLSTQGEKTIELSNLNFAEEEARAIAKLLGTSPLIGEAATKTTFLNAALGMRVIHLATHGLFDETASFQTSGAIALAPDGEHTGWLTAEDIAAMELDADLVVLSACDSGQGKTMNEGAISLARAFLAAGARSVVAALWPVPDKETKSLMLHFYRHLMTGLGVAQALRRAQLEIRTEHPDPATWGAFVAIGNPSIRTHSPNTPSPS